ncbi:MAG TPA: type II toxin-antitoxin system HicA family toxin [Phycisphaerae bacterium]
MSSREIIARLEREGWRRARTKGDHQVFARAGRATPVVVPHPVKDLPIGTLRSIFKQAGWDWKTRS